MSPPTFAISSWNLNERPMMTTTLFDIHPVTQSRITDVDLANLKFGSVFSDHQFRMDFDNGRWSAGVIEPVR